MNDEVEFFDLDNPPDWANEDTEGEKPVGDGEDTADAEVD